MALLIFTPGPDTALVIRNALGSGARAATATAFGIGLGSVAWAVASLLGVAVILETSATAFTVLKLGHGRPAKPSAQPMLDDRTAFQQGLLGNLLNPKAAAIFVTVFPQFIEPGDSPLRLLLMLAAFEAVLLPWLALYGQVVSRAGRSPAGDRVRAWLNRATGVVLVGLGVRLAFERR